MSTRRVLAVFATVADRVQKSIPRSTHLAQQGAALDDPSGIFNASLEGSIRRAIDLHEGDTIDEKALKALIRAAMALNTKKGFRSSNCP